MTSFGFEFQPCWAPSDQSAVRYVSGLAMPKRARAATVRGSSSAKREMRILGSFQWRAMNILVVGVGRRLEQEDAWFAVEYEGSAESSSRLPFFSHSSCLYLKALPNAYTAQQMATIILGFTLKARSSMEGRRRRCLPHTLHTLLPWPAFATAHNPHLAIVHASRSGSRPLIMHRQALEWVMDEEALSNYRAASCALAAGVH